MKMSPNQFEHAVLEIEHIRVVVRAPPMAATLGEYLYLRQARDETSVHEWYQQRIKPLIGDVDCVVLTGYGTTAPPRMTMGTLRKSYEK